VLQRLEHFHVPAGRIYTIADIASDPHYLARGMLQQVTTRDSSLVSLPGIVPKLSRTPGGHRHSAPLAVGQDTVAVLKVISLQNVCTHHGFAFAAFVYYSLQDMGISDSQIEEMRRRGVLSGS
jgi:crotonobetainyl-CoA:carnitine CoA-transferase CaiB-like acyl-CoA transferase